MRNIIMEQEKSRSELAAFLHDFANELEYGDRVTLIVGNESMTLNPPENIHFKLDNNMDTSWIGTEEGQSLRFEFGWQFVDEPENNELSVVKSDHIEPKQRLESDPAV